MTQQTNEKPTAIAEIPTAFPGASIEGKWNTAWQQAAYYRSTPVAGKPSFSLAVPPPNVTGNLHMGHAVNATIQDTLARWRRMAGDQVLWQPGTDHAGIATQNVVERMLRSTENKTRHDLGRDAFISRVWEWKEEYGNIIIGQFKRLGSSLDYDRIRFTMDEGYSKAVRKAFVEWFNRGLIYKGLRSINWCPRCLTALSDIEVAHKEQMGKLYHIHYPRPDGSQGLVVATVRPETMLGDVAVAVHPEDERYQHLIGQALMLPLANREIPIIADTYVEKDFGTGALKITPAHDANDFEIGERHQLGIINTLKPDGHLNEFAGAYEGLTREDGRAQIVKDLEAQGFLVKTEDYKNNIGTCDRCSTVIEPYASEQWFVNMKELAQPTIEAVRSGKVTFSPERWGDVLINWMENIKDWCISRQLWWGHQIPVWYGPEGEMIASMDDNPPEIQDGREWRRDPDVLDTWFSSALWPFATLGWPDKTPEFETFYPTSVLSTARDILNLWVARMIFSSLDFLGEIPFHKVIIHATILDREGKRMSKSKGTGVDPLDMIDRYGADACRFWMVGAGTSSQDVRFSDEKLEDSRHFVNKIWNASRFVLMNLEGFDSTFRPDPAQYNLADQWLLSELNRTATTVNQAFDAFEFHRATDALYDFFWNSYCDWYVEMAKPRLQTSDRPVVQYVLAHVLDRCLRLMHPMIPFVTEELWGHLRQITGWSDAGDRAHLTVSRWVGLDEYAPVNESAEKQMALLMEATRAIRNLRAEMNIPPSKVAEQAYFVGDRAAEMAPLLSALQGLARVGVAQIVSEKPDSKQAAVAALPGLEIILPLGGLIDLEKEAQRLEKELSKLQIEAEKLDQKLSNAGFVERAPADVVAKERVRLAELVTQQEVLRDRLQQLAV